MTAALTAWLLCGLLIGASTRRPGDTLIHWLVAATLGPAIFAAALLCRGGKA